MSSLEIGLIEFGLKLDQLISSDSENVVFSPFSLSTALTMTLIGTKNKCGEELSTVLFGKLVKPDEYLSLAEEYHNLVEQCMKSNAQVMCSANFLYSDIKYPILENYKQLIETSFLVKSKELELYSKNKVAIDIINQDIKNATNGKIPAFFEDITAKTVMVLANALYFKGLWKSQFEKCFTKSKKFTISDKKKVNVDMMYKKSMFPFVMNEQLNCRAIQLNYQNSNVVLVVVLPEENSCVTELKSKMNSETLSQLLNELNINSITEVELYLPKFKIESKIPFIRVLRKVGIKQIFDPDIADFSGISSNYSGLHVSDIIQKAVIEVDEEGTEAAAATAVVFSLGYSFSKKFEANRPFLFFLVNKHHNTNVLLFNGTVKNPKV